MFYLTKTFRFEAAHYLPFVSKDHKCRRIHGHSFKCTIQVQGDLDPKMGWVMDYSEIKQIVSPTIKKLDHYFLNEIEGLSNPTSENICQWIWNQISPQLHQLNQIILAETCESECILKRPITSNS